MKERSNLEKIDLEEWKKRVLAYEKQDEEAISKLKNRREDTLVYEKLSENLAQIETRQYSGAILLPGSNKILRISPKTSSRYLHLLQYAQKVKCNDNKPFFFYDCEQVVKTKEGDVFLDIIAHFFLKELERIARMGLVKEYVRREENTTYLKGKLLVSKQIVHNFINPKFVCAYFDLTVDNLTNQVVLFASLKLSRMIRSESGSDEIRIERRKLKERILRYVKLFKDEITIKNDILPSMLDTIKVNRRNEHYREILRLSKLIIRENFFDSPEQEDTKCCSFLIDMNVLFERVVFGLLQELLTKQDEYSLVDQKHYPFNLLEGYKKLKLIPDIVVLKEGEEHCIIDAKYKATIGTLDYHQIILYFTALSIKSQKLKKAFFINFTDGQETDPRISFLKLEKLDKRLCEIEIYEISITLGEEIKDLSYEEYLKGLRKQLIPVISLIKETR
jgi:5-methylcytosine-specific restriction enzyme subunit McrC